VFSYSASLWSEDTRIATNSQHYEGKRSLATPFSFHASLSDFPAIFAYLFALSLYATFLYIYLRIREGITFTFDERATTDASRRPYIRIYDDKQAIIVGAGLRARPEMEKLFNPHS
jgi:hypothetical protein